MENNAERQANTIIEMTREAVISGNERLYWEVLGFVEGMRRSGEFKDEFANLLKNDIRDQWDNRKKKMRDRFRRIWGYSA